jgi:hypothetical protein
MKPVKALSPVAKWLFRLTLLSIIYFAYKDLLIESDFKNINYIIILGISFFSLLLFIGGFLTKSSLTVISGLIIFLLATIKLVLDLPDINTLMIIFISLGFYFLTTGNYSYLKK